VRGNHVELVRSLLGMHPPPRLNLRNYAGMAPIHIACEESGGAIDLALFEALLAARPDVNATNGDGDAPLHVLCREAGSAPFVRALVSRQAESGLEIDKQNLVGICDCAPLSVRVFLLVAVFQFYRARSRLPCRVLLFVAQSLQHQTGATPLMIAIVQGDSPLAVDVTRALMSAKVAPNVNVVNPVCGTDHAVQYLSAVDSHSVLIFQMIVWRHSNAERQLDPACCVQKGICTHGRLPALDRTCYKY
jgi:ankyrin repeat protein